MPENDINKEEFTRRYIDAIARKNNISEDEYKKQYDELMQDLNTEVSPENVEEQENTSDIDTLEQLSEETSLDDNIKNIDEETLKLSEEIEQIKRNRTYDEDSKFIGRSNNIFGNIDNTINLLQEKASLYEQIPMNWEEKRSQITSEKERITSLSIQERKKQMDDICDQLEVELKKIEEDDSLTEEEKEKRKDEVFKYLGEKINLIEDFPNSNQKEQDAKLDEELEYIEDAIIKDQRAIKKEMSHIMVMRILLLSRYLKKGYDKQEIFDDLVKLSTIELENKTLQEYMHRTFDETLLRNPELKEFYIAYSEKNNNKENNENDKDKKETQENDGDLPINTTEDKIEEPIISSDEPDNDISSNSDDEGNQEFDEDPNLEEENVQNENDDDDEISEDEIDNEEPEIPTIIENSPKKSWKTWLGLAAGIGVGATVFFTAGSVGVSVLAISGGIAKRLISKRRKKLEAQRLSGELEVENVEEPQEGIKGKIENLKKYFKSEEFCRDATWFLNGAIYTGLGLNVASSIYNFASAKLGSANTVNTDAIQMSSPNNSADVISDAQVGNLDSVASTPNIDPTEGIKIGDNVGNYNVSVGHDTASCATHGTHTENLISKYVNEDSIFKSFRVVNSDGTLGQAINTNGLSVTDFCNQTGIDPSQIAVDVANKNGASQAWVSVSELIKGTGGKIK